MTKKDYIRAAEIIRTLAPRGVDVESPIALGQGGRAWVAREAFVTLFAGEVGARFDADRFRAACEPAPAPKNVKVRNRKVGAL